MRSVQVLILYCDGLEKFKEIRRRRKRVEIESRCCFKRTYVQFGFSDTVLNLDLSVFFQGPLRSSVGRRRGWFHASCKLYACLVVFGRLL